MATRATPRLAALTAVACLLSLSSCGRKTHGGPSSSPAPSASSTPSPGPGAYAFVGAGDIASNATDAERTAKLLDAEVARDPAAVVFTTGDNAYPDGTAANLAAYYAPTWGRHRARTRPTPGNHDYHVAGAADYLDYFCASPSACSFPGGSQRLYYSYDVGNWHVVALDSEADIAAGSAQLRWLQADLAAQTRRCILAYWHRPLFSSGTTHGGSVAVKPFWDALHAAQADVVLAGHEHNYERFAKQDPTGAADPRGIRQLVVGNGGASTTSYAFGAPRANSEVRYGGANAWGILRLTLRDGSYDWEFLPVQGGSFTDSGTGTCNR